MTVQEKSPQTLLRAAASNDLPPALVVGILPGGVRRLPMNSRVMRIRKLFPGYRERREYSEHCGCTRCTETRTRIAAIMARLSGDRRTGTVRGWSR